MRSGSYRAFRGRVWLFPGFPRARLFVPGRPALSSRTCCRRLLRRTLGSISARSTLQSSSSSRVCRCVLCVCARAHARIVCVRERERERERGVGRTRGGSLSAQLASALSMPMEVIRRRGVARSPGPRKVGFLSLVLWVLSELGTHSPAVETPSLSDWCC